jgi:hypothetical protein
MSGRALAKAIVGWVLRGLALSRCDGFLSNFASASKYSFSSLVTIFTLNIIIYNTIIKYYYNISKK